MAKLMLAAMMSVIAFSLVACQSSTHSPGSSLPILHVERLQSVGYDMVDAYVFQPYCMSCHDGNTKPNLSSYSLVMQKIGAIDYTCLGTTDFTKIMPKNRSGGLPPEQKKLLQLWIDMGAPEASTRINNGGGTPGKTVTFKQVYAQVFERSCTRCHKAKNHWKLKDYSDIAMVRKQIRGIVFTIAMQYMPPKDKPPVPLPKHWMEDDALKPGINKNLLNSQQKTLLLEWVKLGMPN